MLKKFGKEKIRSCMDMVVSQEMIKQLELIEVGDGLFAKKDNDTIYVMFCNDNKVYFDYLERPTVDFYKELLQTISDALQSSNVKEEEIKTVTLIDLENLRMY